MLLPALNAFNPYNLFSHLPPSIRFFFGLSQTQSDVLKCLLFFTGIARFCVFFLIFPAVLSTSICYPDLVCGCETHFRLSLKTYFGFTSYFSALFPCRFLFTFRLVFAQVKSSTPWISLVEPEDYLFHTLLSSRISATTLTRP